MGEARNAACLVGQKVPPSKKQDTWPDRTPVPTALSCKELLCVWRGRAEEREGPCRRRTQRGLGTTVEDGEPRAMAQWVSCPPRMARDHRPHPLHTSAFKRVREDIAGRLEDTLDQALLPTFRFGVYFCKRSIRSPASLSISAHFHQYLPSASHGASTESGARE